jgi:hypothetical protein
MSIMKIKQKIKLYFKALLMALLGKVSENNTYDRQVHCN